MEIVIKLAFIYHDAVSVKNADLICLNQESDDYDLQHYRTIILKVRNHVVTDIKPCSQSSTRAINQALSYLGFNDSCKDIVKRLESEGVTIDRSY